MLAATLNASCKPDDVHTVRKLALRYRNLLDVFSPAYPNATASPEDSGRAATSDKKKKHDKWYHIRHRIDDGYTKMGDLQDLSHAKVPYTPKDLKKRLDVVLDWYSDWSLYNSSRNYSEFARSAPLAGTNTFVHPESQFFWALNDSAIPGSSTISGISGVRALVRLQLSSISATNKAMEALPSILPKSAHDQFHDFRKKLRAVRDEATEFSGDAVPIFVANATGVQQGLDLFDTLYDMYGDLNDLWTKYDYFKEKKDKTEEQKAAAKVNASWAELRAFQTNASLVPRIGELTAGLTTACP